MLILNEIKEKLKTIDSNIFFGAVDNSVNETLWNYIVFNREELNFSENKTSCTTVYSFHIVRENFIPENLEREVISILKTIPGLRMSKGGNYSYFTKPGTRNVVEMFSMEFIIPEKVTKNG